MTPLKEMIEAVCPEKDERQWMTRRALSKVIKDAFDLGYRLGREDEARDDHKELFS